MNFTGQLIVYGGLWLAMLAIACFPREERSDDD